MSHLTGSLDALDAAFTDQHAEDIGTACEALWNEHRHHTPRPADDWRVLAANKALEGTNAALALVVQYYKAKADLGEALKRIDALEHDARRYGLVKAGYVGADFYYPEREGKVVLLIELPDGCSVSANLDATLDRSLSRSAPLGSPRSDIEDTNGDV